MIQKKVQSMREFMVAQIGHIIAQQVHRCDHRMHGTRCVRGGHGFNFAQGAALQEIAIVHQHATAHFGSRFRDQAGGAGQAHGRAGAVLQIVP